VTLVGVVLRHRRAGAGIARLHWREARQEAAAGGSGSRTGAARRLRCAAHPRKSPPTTAPCRAHNERWRATCLRSCFGVRAGRRGVSRSEVLGGGRAPARPGDMNAAARPGDLRTLRCMNARRLARLHQREARQGAAAGGSGSRTGAARRLRCAARIRGRAAQLAALTSFAPLKQSAASQITMRAARADPESSAAHPRKSPPTTAPCRAHHGGGVPTVRTPRRVGAGRRGVSRSEVLGGGRACPPGGHERRGTPRRPALAPMPAHESAEEHETP